MIAGCYTISAISIERYIEVKSRTTRMNDKKWKPIVIFFYSVLVWLFAFLFSVPLILSVELKLSGDWYSCESSWYKENYFYNRKLALDL
jgi:uncharacterized membrane-anchored protein